jgi:hypothetical protein
MIFMDAERKMLADLTFLGINQKARFPDFQLVFPLSMIMGCSKR